MRSSSLPTSSWPQSVTIVLNSFCATIRTVTILHLMVYLFGKTGLPTMFSALSHWAWQQPQLKRHF
jgi:hypothetical protein